MNSSEGPTKLFPFRSLGLPLSFHVDKAIILKGGERRWDISRRRKGGMEQKREERSRIPPAPKNRSFSLLERRPMRGGHKKGGPRKTFEQTDGETKFFFLWLQLLICHPKTDNWVTTQPLPQMWRQFFFLSRVLTERERKSILYPTKLSLLSLPIKNWGSPLLFFPIFLSSLSFLFSSEARSPYLLFLLQ